MRGSELVGAAGIFRKPALADTLFLLEHFLDAPEGGEREHAQEDGQQDVAHAQGACRSDDAQQQEYPPAACAPVVFGFDYSRMKQADDQKGADACHQAEKMVFVQKVHWIRGELLRIKG